MPNKENSTPPQVEPSWLTFTTFAAAGTAATRFILLNIGIVGLQSRIPEEIDYGVIAGFGLLALGLSLVKPLDSRYRTHPFYAGLMLGASIGLAFESPTIGLPLGITALGFFTAGLWAESMLPK